MGFYRAFIKLCLIVSKDIKILCSPHRHKMDVANMVYCAYQVELKREKLSIMVNMMADERTCTEGAVQIRDWQFGAWRNR